MNAAAAAGPGGGVVHSRTHAAFRLGFLWAMGLVLAVYVAALILHGVGWGPSLNGWYGTLVDNLAGAGSGLVTRRGVLAGGLASRASAPGGPARGGWGRFIRRGRHVLHGDPDHDWVSALPRARRRGVPGFQRADDGRTGRRRTPPRARGEVARLAGLRGWVPRRSRGADGRAAPIAGRRPRGPPIVGHPSGSRLPDARPDPRGDHRRDQRPG